MTVPKLLDMVLETATSPGTGLFVLNGSTLNRRTFADALPGGGDVYYYADDGSQTEWGVGTLIVGAPASLVRKTIIGNTQSTKDPMNFTGTVRVYSWLPGSALPTQDPDGNTSLPASLSVAGDVTIGGAASIKGLLQVPDLKDYTSSFALNARTAVKGIQIGVPVTRYGVVNDPTGQIVDTNTAAYQAAIADLAGKFTIVHPAGLSVVLHSITLTQSNLHFDIDGTWILAPNENQNVINLGGQNAGGTLSNIRFTGSGIIDGNKANQQGGDTAVSGGICANTWSHQGSLIDKPSKPVTISRLVIEGLTIQNCFNWPVSLGYIDQSRLCAIRMQNSGNSPQFIFSADDSWLTDSISTGHTDGGFVFYQGCRRCGARGNNIWGNHDGIGVYADLASMSADDFIIIQGNHVYGNRDSGIGITTGTQAADNPTIAQLIQKHILVTDNVLYNNNTGGRNGGGSIGIVGAYGVYVSSNIIHGDGVNNTSGNTAYSIYVDDTSQFIVVENNIISNVGSAAAPGVAIYINNPRNTRVANNTIYDTSGASGTTMAGIGGGFGTGGSIGGNTLIGQINGHLMEVNLLADTVVFGQQREDGKLQFTMGAVFSDDVSLDSGFLGLTTYPNAAAAGNNQATANPVGQQSVTVTSAANGAGLILLGTAGLGVWWRIQNRSGADIYVYPPVGGQIEGLALNAGFLVPNTCSVVFIRESSALSGGEWRAILTGTVIPSGDFQVRSGVIASSSYPNATGAGSTQSDANPIQQQYTVVVAAGSQTGLRLISSGTGIEYTVFNRSGSSVLIYPPAGGQIEALGINAPMTVPQAGTVKFVRFSSQYSGGQWFALNAAA